MVHWSIQFTRRIKLLPSRRSIELRREPRLEAATRLFELGLRPPGTQCRFRCKAIEKSVSHCTTTLPVIFGWTEQK